MDTLLITGTLLSSLLDHNASWPYQTASELPAQMYNIHDEYKHIQTVEGQSYTRIPSSQTK
jgi:hypothetical protein